MRSLRPPHKPQRLLPPKRRFPTSRPSPPHPLSARAKSSLPKVQQRNRPPPQRTLTPAAVAPRHVRLHNAGAACQGVTASAFHLPSHRPHRPMRPSAQALAMALSPFRHLLLAVMRQEEIAARRRVQRLHFESSANLPPAKMGSVSWRPIPIIPSSPSALIQHCNRDDPLYLLLAEEHQHLPRRDVPQPLL